MKTAKSILNELCQSRYLPQPFYRDLPPTGPPHQRQFVSQIILYDQTQLVGSPAKSKQEAQHAAAQAALDWLGWNNDRPSQLAASSVFQSNLEHFLLSKSSTCTAELAQTVCIIDYENLPQLYPVVCGCGIPTIYVVLGEYHHKAEEEFPEAIKVLCPSMSSNAVDTCITMLVGRLLESSEFRTYILVSRDKFVNNVAELITKPVTQYKFPQQNPQQPLWPPAQAVIATREAHILAAIANLKAGAA
jgi:hypothetical protein